MENEDEYKINFITMETNHNQTQDMH